MKPVWIDLDNSPHVPLFDPLVRDLRRAGVPVMLTARDAFQVVALARLHGLGCEVVGRHYGGNPFMKVVGLGVRTSQLLARVASRRPALAVSHGSRAQILAARALGVPTMLLADYEHAVQPVRCDWIVVPEAIPADAASRLGRRVLRYPGIKEDVYAPGFTPDQDLRERLGVLPADVLVTVRPPATEAHYHHPEGEALFDAVMHHLAAAPDVRAVILPRTPRQREEIVRRWQALVTTRKVIMPEAALNGMNLVWHSDLVVSGGGTMNREAVALGVPVYSIFRGALGAVDAYLAATGRLVLVPSALDVPRLIALTRRERHVRGGAAGGAARAFILRAILGALPQQDQGAAAQRQSRQGS